MMPLKDTYQGEKLVKEDFSDEKIESVLFEDCEFSGCLFINTQLEKVRFIDCKFIECDLSSLVPTNCSFSKTEFRRCKAIGIDWTRAKSIEGISFTECIINYSNFRRLALPKIKMRKCEVKEADFIETDISKGIFRGSDFENSVFFKTNLTEADFRGALNYNIDIRANTVATARFSLPEAMDLLSSSEIIIDQG